MIITFSGQIGFASEAEPESPYQRYEDGFYDDAGGGGCGDTDEDDYDDNDDDDDDDNCDDGDDNQGWTGCLADCDKEGKPIFSCSSN